jgi:phage anti-repressor protein
MTPLIKIEQGTIGGEEIQTVDARKLHKFLKVGRNFSNWIKGRISEYGFVEDQDFATAENLSTPNPARANSRAQRTIEYYLSLDMAKELSMVERTEKGREARRYFIECERIALGKIAEPIDDDELSTVKDRTPLYHGAIDIVLEHRLSFGNAYQALNWFAGSKRFPEMTKRQVAETAGFLRRLLTGEATQKDFQRISVNQAALTGEAKQLPLITMTIPLVYGGKT